MTRQMQGLRAFFFYIDDWLSSTRIAAMTAEEERAYLRLLLHAAKQPDGGLPQDDKFLAEISLLGRKWKGESGRKVRACFNARDGRLYNPRLSREVEYQHKYHAEKTAAGRRGGLAKAAKTASEPPSKPPSELLANDLANHLANGWRNGANGNSNRNKKQRESTLCPESNGFLKGGGDLEQAPPRPEKHSEPNPDVDHAAEFARQQAKRDKEREAELQRRSMA